MSSTKSPKLTILIFSLVVLTAFVLLIGNISAAISPSLGTADSFAVLAYSKVENTGFSVVTGDVGLSPTTGAAITGFPPGMVIGNIYSVDAFGPAGSINNPGLLTTAKTDLSTAYTTGLGSQACTTDYGAATSQDLSGYTLVPGVYCAGDFALSGTLTLSGSSSDVWIFKTYGSSPTLVTSGTAKIVGGNPCNVWWMVASSATLGTNTQLIGNILALTSITLNTGATLNGRALAQNGAVTLDSNTISSMVCGSINESSPANLTVVKVVSGGTAVVSDFILKINDTQVLNGIPKEVMPGTYVVSEIPVLGYNGVISGDCYSNGTVILTAGQRKTCIITNTYVPPTTDSASLTVTKVVINDNGGTAVVSDFTLLVGGSSVISGTTYSVASGTYVISEVANSGYSATFSGACSADGTVVLNVGDVKTCTITNNDIRPKSISVMGDNFIILLIIFTLILGLYGLKRYGK